MRVYVDSSALLKRVVDEAESEVVEEVLARHVDADDVLAASSLAWVEVSRALRSGWDTEDTDTISEAVEDALSGIAERAVSAEVISLARRIGPLLLRSLDAIHLATAVLLEADRMLTYDDRLGEAARHNGIRVSTPQPPAEADD